MPTPYRVSLLGGERLSTAVEMALAKKGTPMRLSARWDAPAAQAEVFMLIEREHMSVMYNSYLRSWRAAYQNGETAWGLTPATAALRCFVTRQFGPFIELPESGLVPTMEEA